MERIKVLYGNLTKRQRFAIFIGLQAFVIIIFVAIISSQFNNRNHVVLRDDTGSMHNIPSDEQQFLKENLWLHVSNVSNDLDKSVLNDVNVREDSYEETTNNDITTADFLVDIDSLKQTYHITISWSKSKELPNGLTISCPPISEMKYKETFCQGMYDNTNSFELYFPYDNFETVVCDNEEDGDCEKGKRKELTYSIYGNEDTKTINIESSVCDPEKYNKEALEYIKNYTPFYNNSDYTIQYSVNSVDVICN